MKVASLVLSLLVATPSGAALAAPDAPPPAAAPVEAAPAAPVPAGAAAPAGAVAPAGGPAALSMGSPSWMGPPSEAGAGPAAPAAVEPEAPRSGEKSTLIAFSLSFSMPIAVVAAGVLMDPDEGAGAALFILGGVVGPSTGWLYAGRPGLAALTAGMRLGGGLLAIRVLDDRPGRSEAWPLLGMAIFATATLIDWIGPAVSVANANERATKATVVPTVTPGGGAGLSFVGAF